MQCEFCKKKFSTKGNMVRHQKTIEQCLKIQQITKEKKILTTQLFDERRKNSKAELLLTIQKIEKENSDLKERVREQHEHVKELENKLENIALKAVSKPTITNNTSNKTQINYLRPISDERFNESVHQLTLEYLLKGPQGYAQFALDHPLKDSVVCSDYARRKIEYKEENGTIKTDPEMTYISSKFFTAIKNTNKHILLKHGVDIYNDNGDDYDFIENELKKIAEYIMSVNKGSQGEKTEFHHDFVKEVCCRTVKGDEGD